MGEDSAMDTSHGLSANKQKRPLARSPSSPSSGDGAKKANFADYIGASEEVVAGFIDLLGSPDGQLSLSAEKMSELRSIVSNLYSFTKDVINGQSEFMIESVKEERRLRTAVFNLKLVAPLQTGNKQVDAEKLVDRELKEQYEVKTILKFLNVGESPSSIHRISPFLVKVELPSQSSLRKLLANRKHLADSKWKGIYVRESLTTAQRDQRKVDMDRKAYMNELEPGKWVFYRNAFRLKDEVSANRETAPDRSQEAPVPPVSWQPTRRYSDVVRPLN